MTVYYKNGKVVGVHKEINARLQTGRSAGFQTGIREMHTEIDEYLKSEEGKMLMRKTQRTGRGGICGYQAGL